MHGQYNHTEIACLVSNLRRRRKIFLL